MLKLTPIPALSDNYIWAIYDEDWCVIIDPGEASPVLAFLADNNLRLTGILLTHHHMDHIGGVDELLQAHRKQYPSASALPVFGPEDNRIKTLTQVVAEGDKVTLEPWQLAFEVLEIPGHTRSHIAFWNEQWLFCGDTLFSAGCGRLFEGTPEQMQHSLDKLAKLPDELLVCCAHEYTQANCEFALQVEPDNTALQQRYQQVRQMRQNDQVTLPVPLSDELSYNPFLRSRQPSVIQAASQRLADTDQDKDTSHKSSQDLNQDLSQNLNLEPHAVLAVIRSWKDAA